MKIVKKNETLSLLGTMYPAKIVNLCSKAVYSIPEGSTVYGLMLDGRMAFVAKGLPSPVVVQKGQYFCVPHKDSEFLDVDGHAVFFVRYGFSGQLTLGGSIEDSGRLTYIDNCSSSLLVYPPRRGDPSMSMLAFPKRVVQTYHIHPSVRLGVITKGKGYANVGTSSANIRLTPGTVFCMEEREIHRFVTQDSTLTFVSFHPDGDWGPEDDTHPVQGRTYLEKPQK